MSSNQSTIPMLSREAPFAAVDPDNISLLDEESTQFVRDYSLAELEHLIFDRASRYDEAFVKTFAAEALLRIDGIITTMEVGIKQDLSEAGEDSPTELIGHKIYNVSQLCMFDPVVAYIINHDLMDELNVILTNISIRNKALELQLAN
jgi:hypothetical protein